MSLFHYYHIFIYLLLCFFPLSVFLALRVIGLPWIVAGVGAVLGTHISTDGLYGLDPSSFLWRGYGLSSQLFAMIWFPLAVAFSFKYLTANTFIPIKTLGNEFLKQLIDILPSSLSTVFDNGKGKMKFSQIAFQAFHDTHMEPTNNAGNKNSAIHNQNLRAADQENVHFPGHWYFWGAVTFTIFTTMGHLGLGVMALLSAAVFAVTDPLIHTLEKHSLSAIRDSLLRSVIRLGFLGLAVIFFLSYWIIPTVLYNNFHNISVWDPIWKFNSYGWKEVLIRFFNGNLFDWGRAPVFTLLTLIGAFTAAFIHRGQGSGVKGQVDSQATLNNNTQYLIHNSYFGFTLLFLFWLVLYFGRTTWGGLIDLIPGMTEFHISRFLVGLHIAGMFAAPIGLYSLALGISYLLFKIISTKKHVKPGHIPQWLTWSIILVTLFLVARPLYTYTIYYNELNDKLIVQGNDNYLRDSPAIDGMMAEIRKLPPARVFAGRGGGWGKNFTLAETQMFMHISTYGIPTALWLPETWSPNSDTEQYFSEDVAKDYDIYNLRWIAAPPSVPPQPFWKVVMTHNSWVIYEAPTSGYFTIGRRNMTVVADKTDLINIVRLWIQSPVPTQKLYPEILFKKPAKPLSWPVPVVEMTDEVTYKNLKTDSGFQNIWAQNPIYAGDPPSVSLIGPEKVDTDMIFETKVEVSPNCSQCLVVLKQTYHPNWRVWINGKPVKTMIVFPFHMGIPMDQPGIHEIKAAYIPHPVKLPLIIIALVTGIIILLGFYKNKRNLK
ncbi:hypothetical protein A2154_03855 [Candidatus Gottesmanbacteria bacterium RBG_16_43_7]|uniref:Uncharacterized protein n=1 Tax=Candidatus Gottesmanbacteria bacterium RBG_16_43_7 TaxID=1798373 RepID=A0A1F5Z9Q7_9BACT|nr:MAG: hypothetical protein A2154_03855 [Candidatus Gottesmanbacteria bacterium RBG_16_43_7]